MADTLTTITNTINSPPGQLVAGSALFGIVYKFFAWVEDLLSDMTKLEIAVWLVGVNAGKKLEPWPNTFAKIFDRVFGKKHLSWKCFLRSSFVSCIAIGLTLLVTFAIHGLNWYVAKNIIHEGHLWFAAVVVAANLIPDYLSLLKTRFLLSFAQRSSSSVHQLGILIVDLIVTLYVALVSVTYGLSTVLASTFTGLSVGMLLDPKVLLSPFHPAELFISARMLNEPGVASLWFYPAFFTSVWLWLYAGSGFLLRVARRFDSGFEWFNRKFDIEKKPLRSIGLVAGALVAMVYWAAVMARRLL